MMYHRITPLDHCHPRLVVMPSLPRKVSSCSRPKAPSNFSELPMICASTSDRTLLSCCRKRPSRSEVCCRLWLWTSS